MEHLNYNVHVEWWKKVQELTSRKGVDIIVEVGGGNTLEQSIKASKTGAVIGIIGVLSGGTAQLPIGRAIAKSSRLIGITCFQSRRPYRRMFKIRSFKFQTSD